MMLRNKETGEIIVGECFTDIVKKLHDQGNILCRAPLLSIDLFAEYWEVYAPKEPKLEDKNARKAVRAWAKYCGIRKVLYAERPNKTLCCFTDMGKDDFAIEFAGSISSLKDGEVYSINELCGEEGK